jgi:hypothetical protein
VAQSAGAYAYLPYLGVIKRLANNENGFYDACKAKPEKLLGALNEMARAHGENEFPADSYLGAKGIAPQGDYVTLLAALGPLAHPECVRRMFHPPPPPPPPGGCPPPP